MKFLTKRYKKTLLLLVVMFAMLTSCKKSFLEIIPKGKVIPQTTNDFDLALNSAQLFNINNTDAQIILGDEVSSLSTYFTSAPLRAQRLFRYEDVIYQPDQDANEMAVLMKTIYLYNYIIADVMDSKGGSEQQKKSIQAEALAGRAWTNFLLINYYGKPYNPATAAMDPGFPIVKDADATITSFRRATVKEMYDFIIEDLSAAIPNLPNNTIHRTRMARAAAEGILGKVYIFMGKYSDALPLLNSAFSHLNSTSITIRLYDYNTDMKAGGALALGSGGIPGNITLPNILENIYARQVNNNYSTQFNTYRFLLNSQTSALFQSADLRLVFFSDRPSTTAAPFAANLKYRRYPSVAQIGFTVPDLYLLRAECNARLNALTNAKIDLEALRIRRMPSGDAVVPAATANDQNALIKFIIDERTREFALQGYRWFDMRRLSVDPLFSSTVLSKHIIYNSSGGIQESYTLKPERLVLRLPQKIIDQNPGMENNN